MKITQCGLGLLMVSALFFSGCESDDSPDSFVFQNDSSYTVTVRLTVNTPADTVQTFSLEPNGGEWQTLKTFVEPLIYSYSPSASVTDRRQGDRVIFENR